MTLSGTLLLGLLPEDFKGFCHQDTAPLFPALPEKGLPEKALRKKSKWKSTHFKYLGF